MAWATYEKAITASLKHEGGYANHPDDPGGPTNYGITLATYRRFAKANATAADVRAMQLATAKNIYRRGYAEPINYGELPAGLDYAMLDYAINSGVGRAPKVLQALVGVAQDGKIGPATLAAIRKRKTADLINALCNERMAFLKRLKTFPTFGKGWTRRVNDVRALALAMAAGAPAPTTTEAPAQGKAEVPAGKAGPIGAGGGVAGTAAVATDAAASGADWIGIAMIIGAGLILSLLFYLWMRGRQEAKQNTPLVAQPVPEYRAVTVIEGA